MARKDPLPEDDALLGTEVDGFLLQARIGSGATGIVYRAERDGVPAAVKVLNEGLGHISSLRRRFEREARVLSRLQHDHVVNIAHFGVVDGVVFIAMELLDGDPLDARLRATPIDPPEALRIMLQVLEGLAYAHERQIVHRDLKPANIFLTRWGEADFVKVLDFGLAKFLSIDELSHEGTLTRKGRVVGTPAYMAPEQITGAPLDVRADVYAAGIVLYEMLADRRPFAYDRRSLLLRAHLFEPVPPIESHRPGIALPEGLEAQLQRALAKDPGDRFAHAGAMLDALRPFANRLTSLEMRPAEASARTRTAATSEVISNEERMEVAQVRPPVLDDKVLDGPQGQPPSSDEITTLERAQVSDRKPKPTSGVVAQVAESVSPEDTTDGREPRPREWLTPLLWVVSLVGLGGVLGVAYYATTLH